MLTHIHNNTNSLGSHMPLDIEPHWSWSNPLNIIPALLLLSLIIGLLGVIF